MTILVRLWGQNGSPVSTRSLETQKCAFDVLKSSNLCSDDISMSPTVQESFSSLDSDSFLNLSALDDVAQQEKVPPTSFSCITPKTTIAVQLGSAKVLPARSSLKQNGSSPCSSRLIGNGRDIEIQLPGARTPIRRKSYIRFVETVRIKRVRPVDELVENPQELWFQWHEYEAMRRKASLIVKKVESGMAGGKKYCVRGLEGIMKGTGRVKYRNKGLEAVLKEQYRQFRKGVFDEERIAKAYRLSSLYSQIEASRRAALDQVDATKYYPRSDDEHQQLTIL